MLRRLLGLPWRVRQHVDEDMVRRWICRGRGWKIAAGLLEPLLPERGATFIQPGPRCHVELRIAERRESGRPDHQAKLIARNAKSVRATKCGKIESDPVSTSGVVVMSHSWTRRTCDRKLCTSRLYKSDWFPIAEAGRFHVKHR